MILLFNGYLTYQKTLVEESKMTEKKNFNTGFSQITFYLDNWTIDNFEFGEEIFLKVNVDEIPDELFNPSRRIQ